MPLHVHKEPLRNASDRHVVRVAKLMVNVSTVADVGVVTAGHALIVIAHASRQTDDVGRARINLVLGNPLQQLRQRVGEIRVDDLATFPLVAIDGDGLFNAPFVFDHDFPLVLNLASRTPHAERFDRSPAVSSAGYFASSARVMRPTSFPLYRPRANRRQAYSLPFAFQP